MDVFSPNHIEIPRIFGKKKHEIFDRTALKDYAARFLTSGVGMFESGTVIAQAGEAGYLVAYTQRSFAWLPPFYDYPI